MKKYLTPYLFTLTFIFGLFMIISLLMVTITYLLPLSSATYNMIILVTSYIVIIAGSYLFIHFVPSKPLIHTVVFGIIYLIISYLACNGVSSLLHLFLKPVIFILCCVIWSVFSKE